MVYVLNYANWLFFSANNKIVTEKKNQGLNQIRILGYHLLAARALRSAGPPLGSLISSCPACPSSSSHLLWSHGLKKPLFASPTSVYLPHGHWCASCFLEDSRRNVSLLGIFVANALAHDMFWYVMIPSLYSSCQYLSWITCHLDPWDDILNCNYSNMLCLLILKVTRCFGVHCLNATKATAWSCLLSPLLLGVCISFYYESDELWNSSSVSTQNLYVRSLICPCSSGRRLW